jgi:hypothetical protein
MTPDNINRLAQDAGFVVNELGEVVVRAPSYDAGPALRKFALAIIAQARAAMRAEMQLMAHASSDPDRRNQLMSKAQYDSALPKNRSKFDIPLYAIPTKD